MERMHPLLERMTKEDIDRFGMTISRYQLDDLILEVSPVQTFILLHLHLNFGL